MARKEKFVPGQYYHIYSRIILNSPKFKDHKNAKKLAQTFLLANSTKSTEAFEYLRTSKNPKFENAIEIAKKGDKLVNIVCYSIMPDHYHLLLKEIKEKGITEFIRKSNISISKYINIKNNRRGALFESRFQAKHVNSNNYLFHLSTYIHLNPLDIISGKEWREHKLKNWNDKKKKLLSYPWTSLRHFLYKEYKDPLISGEKIILDQFKNREEYELFLKEWCVETLDDLKNIIID